MPDNAERVSPIAAAGSVLRNRHPSLKNAGFEIEQRNTQISDCVVSLSQRDLKSYYRDGHREQHVVDVVRFVTGIGEYFGQIAEHFSDHRGVVAIAAESENLAKAHLHNPPLIVRSHHGRYSVARLGSFWTEPSFG